MTEAAGVLTAVAAVIAAIGGIVAAILGYLARRKAERTAAEVVQVGDKVYQLGRRLDGPLSELLESARSLARAEGHAAGEQAQRDRAADAQP